MTDNKRKLLIVEDEIIIAMRLETYFRSNDYNVLGYVTTGEEAIERAINEVPDLIIMDINLKGNMNGLDAAEKIIESRYIPIIFITGYSDEEYKRRAKKLNPLGYFFKPVNLYELLTAINKIDDR